MSGVTGYQSSPPFIWKGISFKQDDRVFKIGTDALLLATWIPKIVSSADYILDVGTGCGVIALLLAKSFPTAQVNGIDPDMHAVELARENCEAADLKNKILNQQSSLEGFVQQADTKFDLIVSNPPFYVNHLRPESTSMQSAKHATASPGVWMNAMTRLMHDDGRIVLILPSPIVFEWIREANQRQWYCSSRMDVYSFDNDFQSKRSLICFNRSLDRPMQARLIMYQTDLSYTAAYQEWLGL